MSENPDAFGADIEAAAPLAAPESRE